MKYVTIHLGGKLELSNDVSVAGRRWVVRHVGTKSTILNIDTDVTPVAVLRAIADEIEGFENPTPEPEKEPDGTTEMNAGTSEVTSGTKEPEEILGPLPLVDELDLPEKVIGYLKAGDVLTIQAAKEHEDLTKIPKIGDATAEDISVAIAIYEDPEESE